MSATTDEGATTPRTWGEYFEARRLAQVEMGSALAAFREAGQRLDECTARKDALESWARAADKVSPYTGVRDDAVINDQEPGS